MANYHGAPIVKTLFLLIVALALAGCAADKPEPLSEIYRLDLGPGMVTAFAVRAYWLESGELSRGIMTDPVATLLAWGAMPDEHRPAATDGGPRISERLAARLGLAYLSFSAPELAVTGKPHSPTVRLMRRHEFMAMQGGSSGAIIPNPMVWVVQAQGSWRSAGIVPEESRREFSVGLVAFDADTGETYGRSHRNEPLLEDGTQ